MIDYFLVFIAMAGVDFLYAEYTKAAADRRTYWASGMAALMIAFNAYVVTMYVGNWLMLIPTAAGAFVGTFISIRFLK